MNLTRMSARGIVTLPALTVEKPPEYRMHCGECGHLMLTNKHDKNLCTNSRCRQWETEFSHSKTGFMNQSSPWKLDAA